MKKNYFAFLCLTPITTLFFSPLSSCACGVTSTNIVAISISKYPQLAFDVNDTFNHDGIIVTSSFNDGSTKDVTSECEFSSPDLTTIGDKDVTIEHKSSGKTITYKIVVKNPTIVYHTVKFMNDSVEHAAQLTINGQKVSKPVNPSQEGKIFKFWSVDKTTQYNFDTPVVADITLYAVFGEAAIQSIRVTQLPVIEFAENAEFKSDGLIVTALYDNYTTKDVTSECTIVAPDMTSFGTKEVEVKYNDLIKTSYKIVIKDPGDTYFNVTFKKGEEVFCTQPVASSKKAFKPVNPTLDGKTFIWWYKDSESSFFDFGTAITSDITLHARFDTQKVSTISISTFPTKIDFNLNDTFTSEGLVITATYDNKTSGVISSGYTVSTPDLEKCGTKDVTVTHTESSATATYKITVKDPTQTYYNVTFDSAGGSSVQAQIIRKNDNAVIPSAPSKAGYLFSKWVKTNDEDYDFNTPVSADLTLKAVYVENKFSVTAASESLDRGTVTIVGGGECTYNQLVTVTAVPNTNFIFDGWYENDTEVSSSLTYSFNVVTSHALIAKFAIAKIKSIYISTMPVIEFTKGSTFNHDGIVVKGLYEDGTTKDETQYCEFSGYDTSIPGTQYVTVTHMNSRKTTSYGIVIKDESSTYHTVTFKNGEEVFCTQPVMYGQKAFKPTSPTPTTTGTFAHWYMGSSPLNSFDFDTPITSDITLNACFWPRQIKYIKITKYPQIEFNVGDEITSAGLEVTGFYDNGTEGILTEMFEYDVSLPTNPPAGSYTVTVTCVWSLYSVPDEEYKIVVKDPTKTYYCVTFNSDGGSAISSSIVAKDQTVAEPTAPTKPGYTFAKWVKEPDESDYDFSTPVTANITLKAVYTINQLNVSLTTESTDKGTVSGSGSYDYNTLVTVKATPKNIYKFEGWYESDTKVSSDVTYSFNVTEARFLTAKFIESDIKSLVVTQGPTKTEFEVDDDFTHEGLVVTATYENGFKKDVTSECSYSGYNMLTSGQQNVIVTHPKFAQSISYYIVVNSEKLNVFNGVLWRQVISACNTFEAIETPTVEDAVTLCKALGVSSPVEKSDAKTTLQDNLVGLVGTVVINGQVHKVRCIDTMHDYIAEGSTVTTTPAALTFDLISLLTWNNGSSLNCYWDASSCYNYTNSTLRANLTKQGTGTVKWETVTTETSENRCALEMMPSYLQIGIKTVQKIVNANTTGEWANLHYYDKLFPLTVKEINKSTSTSQKWSEGTVYKYWEGKSANSDYIKFDTLATVHDYWLSSPYDLNTTTAPIVFNIKNDGNLVCENEATKSLGTSFAFCL